MKLLSKGSFTKAYLNEEQNTVYLLSSDKIKECMVLGWFPESDLFPTIKHSDIEPYDYMMEYYPRTKGLKSFLDTDQYEIYKTLRNVKSFIGRNRHDAYYHYYKQFELLEDENLSELMIEALDGCSNCGSDIGFEISPRNVAVKEGKLVLLDCFFVISDLKHLRK